MAKLVLLVQAATLNPVYVNPDAVQYIAPVTPATCAVHMAHTGPFLINASAAATVAALK